METNSYEGLKVLINALGTLLVPVVLFVLGHWFIKSKERSESAKSDTHCTLQDEFIIPCPKFGTN
jgi:hypothetical protein